MNTKKYLKITGIVLAVPLGLFVIAAVAIPLFFKDDIKKAIDKAAQDYINAHINYDEEGLSISLIRDFPNVSVGVENFSLVNQAPFNGDTLVSIKDFSVSVNIMSVLTNEMKINGLSIDGAKIFGKVNTDGKANWDIVKPDSSATADTSTSALAIAIDHWSITNTYIEYNDKPMSLFAAFDNFNHEGSGNIADIIKIETTTKADKAYVSMAGVSYLNNVQLDAVTNLTIDGDKYTFDENSFKLNDLELLFDGSTTLGDAIGIDMTMKTEQTTFKNLISLIPAVFLEGYDKVEANGTFELNGKISGEYTETTMPKFDFNLLVKEADLKFPDLPSKVSNINLDLNVANKTGQLDNTSIDLKKFTLTMGKNFVNGRFKLEGLDKYLVDTDIKANINLGEVTSFYPLPGTTVKGLLDMNIAGKGLVDIDNSKFPTVNGYANLKNGFVKSADFNMPIENINIESTYSSDGTTAGSNVNLKKISLLLDKDHFGGSLIVNNFDALNYDADLNGRVDLGKIMKIFPVDGLELSGIIDIKELKTKGNMDMINKEAYGQMETSGKASVSNLVYKDKEYVPYGLSITKSEIWFTPAKIMIDSYDGFVEKSDIKLSGHLENYMGFMFGTENTTLGGEMDFYSKNFNSNFFFIEEGVTESTPVEESVYIIPDNIHFILNGKIDELIYDDLTLKQFDGQIELKDGIAYMRNTKFNTLGASFLTNGSYNTTDPAKPSYDFKLNIKEMPIKEAFNYFNVVKALAPIGKSLDGKFSTDIVMKGILKQDYYPDMSTLSMNGTLNIIEAIAKVSEIKVLSGIADKTKMQGLNSYTIKDALMKINIVDGKLSLSPFTMSGNNSFITTTINRSITDNTISHKMLLDAPSSGLKNGASALGLDASTLGDRVNIDFDILGTTLNPKIVMKQALSKGVKTLAKDAVTNKVDTEKAAAEARAKAELDKAKADAEARLKTETDKAKAEAERIKAEAKAKADAEAEKARLEAKKKLEEELKKKGVKFPVK
jgi:hypothetical protein